MTEERLALAELLEKAGEADFLANHYCQRSLGYAVGVSRNDWDELVVTEAEMILFGLVRALARRLDNSASILAVDEPASVVNRPLTVPQ